MLKSYNLLGFLVKYILHQKKKRVKNLKLVEYLKNLPIFANPFFDEN